MCLWKNSLADGEDQCGFLCSYNRILCQGCENHMADQFDLDFWYADFEHKKTHEGLWLDSRGNLPLVAAEVAATAPGTVLHGIRSLQNI